jgi:hypothetical protein
MGHVCDLWPDGFATYVFVWAGLFRSLILHVQSGSSDWLLGNEGSLHFLELGCSWRKPAARGCSQETKVVLSLAAYVWQTPAHLEHTYLIQVHKQDMVQQWDRLASA